jgi:hypothetical protein
MSDNPNPLNNPDGIRRYEQLTADIRKTADEALGIAIANSILGRDVVLDIPHGGTGTNYKSWVDTYSNQFEIHGAKIFHDSCGFQKESDIVDSGELAGNIRLITCDEEAQDIGPQMRFSGRNTLGDPSGFAFGTIAGRKSNSISGDKAGYLQFSTTTGGPEITDLGSGFDPGGGEIREAVRIDEEQNMGIGTSIPTKGLKNRLWISGGDIYVDSVGGDRSIKLELNHTCLGRIQARHGGTTGSLGTDPIEDVDALMTLSTNAFFPIAPGCEIDDPRKGVAAINLISHVELPGTIEFLIGELDSCPMVRGVFSDTGLDVAGHVIATGDVIAGSAVNAENAAGNNNALLPGFVTGDNVHAGTGDPNNVVNAPIGAIYGRRDAPTENLALYSKTSDDYGPTGWTAVPLQALSTFCIGVGCPDPTQCAQWFDTVNNMIWSWFPNAKGPGIGAWLSANVFQASQRVPIGELAGGLQVAEDFRGRINKHYVYFTPTNIGQNKRHPTQKFDLFLDTLTTAFRVRNNGLDPVKNYYLFDLVTLMTRQGEPLGGVAKQEWPGDRAADDFTGDTNGDALTNSDITGFGHSFHLLMTPNLVTRTLPASGGVVFWTMTVASIINTRKFTFDPATVICYDVNGSPTGCSDPAIARHGFQQNLHRDTPNRAYNPGYVVAVTSGVDVGQVVMILDNNSDQDTSPSITTRKPLVGLSIGDTIEVYSVDYKRIITRVSTKGQVWYPNGPYSNAKTKDIQDFIETGAHATAFQALDPSNPYPGGDADRHLPIELYIPLVDGGDGIAPVDAVVLAGLWDAIGLPGMIAGSVSLTFRLALPNSGGICANPGSGS